jgi:TolA-binding protein
MNSTQMDTAHGAAQPDYVSISSLARPSADAPADAPAKVKNDRLPAGSLWRSLTFARYLIVLVIGVAATLAWQTYGESATQMIARVVSSPDHRRLTSTSVDLTAMRQGIDDLATSIASNQEQIMRSIVTNQAQALRSIAMNQELILRNVDQLAAGQEQMAREIAKFQTQDQSGLAQASASKPAPRPAQKPAVLTPAKTP